MSREIDSWVWFFPWLWSCSSLSLLSTSMGIVDAWGINNCLTWLVEGREHEIFLKRQRSFIRVTSDGVQFRMLLLVQYLQLLKKGYKPSTGWLCTHDQMVQFSWVVDLGRKERLLLGICQEPPLLEVESDKKICVWYLLRIRSQEKEVKEAEKGRGSS